MRNVLCVLAVLASFVSPPVTHSQEIRVLGVGEEYDAVCRRRSRELLELRVQLAAMQGRMEGRGADARMGQDIALAAALQQIAGNQQTQIAIMQAQLQCCMGRPERPVDPGYGIPTFPLVPSQGLPTPPVYPSQGLPSGPNYPSNPIALPPNYPGNALPTPPQLPPYPAQLPTVPQLPPGWTVSPVPPGWNVTPPPSAATPRMGGYDTYDGRVLRLPIEPFIHRGAELPVSPYLQRGLELRIDPYFQRPVEVPVSPYVPPTAQGSSGPLRLRLFLRLLARLGTVWHRRSQSLVLCRANRSIRMLCVASGIEFRVGFPAPQGGTARQGELHFWPARHSFVVHRKVSCHENDSFTFGVRPAAGRGVLSTGAGVYAAGVERDSNGR